MIYFQFQKYFFQIVGCFGDIFVLCFTYQTSACCFIYLPKLYFPESFCPILVIKGLDDISLGIIFNDKMNQMTWINDISEIVHISQNSLLSSIS